MRNNDQESKLKSKIEYYKDLAKNIKDNLSSRKKPLIVEFTGLPKSGKTTVLNNLSLFLRRNGISNIIITERASECPIKDKHSPEFNIWTGCMTLVNILNLSQTNNYDVIIVDRGIFDSLIWLNLMKERRKIISDELKIFENFFLLDRWRKKIDLIVLMTCNIEIALQREFKDLLTDIEGSIMNREFLKKFYDTVKSTKNKYQNLFNELIITIDTSSTTTVEGVEKVIDAVLNKLNDLTIEKVMTISKEPLIQKNTTSITGFKEIEINTLQDYFDNLIEVPRTKAEESLNNVQIIVGAYFLYKESISLITRDEPGSLNKKNMIWIGGHLQKNDVNNDNIFNSLVNCLIREIKQELQISDTHDLIPELKGLIYDNTSSESSRHLCVMFEIKIGDYNIYAALNNKKFYESDSKSFYLKFLELNEENFKNIKLENWSVDTLQYLFKINAKRIENSQQLRIF